MPQERLSYKTEGNTHIVGFKLEVYGKCRDYWKNTAISMCQYTRQLNKQYSTEMTREKYSQLICVFTVKILQVHITGAFKWWQTLHSISYSWLECL